MGSETGLSIPPIPGLLLALIWAWPGSTPVELSYKNVPDDSCIQWYACRDSVLRNPWLRLGPELGA